MQALRALLENKDFSDITTLEIARKAGVTESLIYKYFKDKRDLLYQVLAGYMEKFLVQARSDLGGIQGAGNKLRKTVWTHVNSYATDRVFAKILLLEVRSYSDYYSSQPYELVKQYSRILREIIQKGVETGEIRNDMSPRIICQIFLGGIEHICLTKVAFNREMDPDQLTEEYCRFIFSGLAPPGTGSPPA